MVITSDEEVWKRAVMFHDVAGGRRYRFPENEILWGINFRMPELLAAVALGQLGRLDGLIDALRARKHLLRAGIRTWRLVISTKDNNLAPADKQTGPSAPILTHRPYAERINALRTGTGPARSAQYGGVK